MLKCRWATILCAAVLAAGLVRPIPALAAEESVRWLPEVSDPQLFSDGVSQVSLRSRPVFIDSDGEMVMYAPERSTNRFQEGLLRVEDRASLEYGFLDLRGEQVFPEKFIAAEPFIQGRTVVWTGGGEKVLDASGAVVAEVPEGYQIAGLLLPDERLLPVRETESGKAGYFDVTDGGMVVSCRYDRVGSFCGGYAPVMLDGAYGVVDCTGACTVPAVYENIMLGVLDGPGGPLYNDASAGFWARYGGKWGLIDGENRQISPFLYDNVHPFCCGLASVERDGAQGYVDRQGREVIPLGTYAKCGDFSSGLACVADPLTGKRGYIDTMGELVVAYQFDAAYPFTDGVAWVQSGGRWGLLDSPLTSPRSAWAAAELARAEEAGLFTLRTKHRCGEEITRLQLAELVVNLVERTTGRELPDGGLRFTDTADCYVRAAACAGLVNGVGDGERFDPDAAVTREQLAAMICRAVRVVEAATGKRVLAESGSLSAYSDAAMLSPWALEDVSALCGADILHGASSDTLSPQGTATVEQTVVLIWRVWERLEETR